MLCSYEFRVIRDIRERFRNDIHTVIHTNTYSYLVDTYLLVLMSCKHHTYNIHVHSYCLRPSHTTVFLLSCNIRLYSYHTWKVCVNAAHLFLFIHKKKSYFVVLARTCLIIILLLSRKNRVQMKNFWFMLPAAGTNTNFKLFTFVLIREQIRHSGTGA